MLDTVPALTGPELIKQSSRKKRNDVHVVPAWATYFYRFNTRRKPFDNPLVRKAFAKAVDKEAIVRSVTAMGEKPADRFVPPTLSDYPPDDEQFGLSYEPQVAAGLLAEAGYSDGKGLGTVELLYNRAEKHEKIAEAVARMWRENLNVKVELVSQEWKVFAQNLDEGNYQVARSSWYGDYGDPTTFLDVFTSSSGNNRTGWTDSRYDRLLSRADEEADSRRRFKLLSAAERILVEDGVPLLPLFHPSQVYLFDPERLVGFYPNARAIHPLKYLACYK
jgi:oligopeptide transport system substrate-binding protein